MAVFLGAIGSTALPTRTISRGTSLLHGTSGRVMWTQPRPLAHFTTSLEAAGEYAYAVGDGTAPRILHFKTLHPLRVLDVPGIHDRRYPEALARLEAALGVSFRGLGYTLLPEAMAAVARAGYDGLRLAQADHGADDIMVADPKAVKLVGVGEIDPRWRPD